MVSILPQARPQYSDANGFPLVGGSVEFCIPGTTTLKETFSDSGGTVLNTNPVILDAAGRCSAWGTGFYRQIVKDVAGNLIWDQVVGGGGSAGGGGGFTFNARLYGATGDGATDDTVALNSVITAAAAGNGSVYIPGGTYIISAALVVPPLAALIIFGDGTNCTILIQTSPTANGIVFSNPPNAGPVYGGCGVRDLTIKGGTTFGAVGSTGIGLLVQSANETFIGQNVDVLSFGTGISLVGSWNTRWYNCRVTWHLFDGIQIGVDDAYPVSGGNSFNGCLVANNGFTFTNTNTGFGIYKTGGEYFTNCEATACGTGWGIKPKVGTQAAYLFFTSCLGDTSQSLGWFFNGTAGSIFSVTCIGCWAAFTGNGGAGVAFQGTMDSVRWLSGRVRENAGHGFELLAGGAMTRVVIQGTEIASNGRTANAGLMVGISVAPGVSEFAIQDNQIGNFASAYHNQGSSIVIGVGSSNNFIITGNVTINPAGGSVPIVNGTMVDEQSYIVANNLPNGAAGNNVQAAGAVYPFASLPGVGGSGSTIYLGCNGATTGGENLMSVCSLGSVSRAVVEVVTAPVAGESYICTVLVNGALTGITGTIASGLFKAVLTGPAAQVFDGDGVTVAVRSSSGAAANQFRGYVRIDS